MCYTIADASHFLGAETTLPVSPHGVLTHEVLPSFEIARMQQPQWDALAEQCGDLFCTLDWCASWWRHFGRRRRLQIHIWRDTDRIVAILPLFCEILSLGLMRLRLVRIVGCDHSLTAVSLPIHEDYRHTVASSLLSFLNRAVSWDALHLGPFRSYMTGGAELAAIFGALPGVDLVIRGVHDACSMLFPLPRDYEAYLRDVPGHERANIVRCDRRLRTGHSVRTELPRDPAAIRAATELLIQLHQEMWTRRGLAGQFYDWPGLARFLRNITAARWRDVLAPTVVVDGAPAGVELGFRFGTRVHTLFRGYREDNELGDASLGRMLHCLMARCAIENGATVLDDGGGAFEYKRRLGGLLACEQSLTIVRRGAARLRFPAALCLARMIQSVSHHRLNRVRAWLGMRPTPFRERDIRLRSIANVGRRTTLPLFGHATFAETKCRGNIAFCPRCGVPAAPASWAPCRPGRAASPAPRDGLPLRASETSAEPRTSCSDGGPVPPSDTCAADRLRV